jgi:WD40 repeat protein
MAAGVQRVEFTDSSCDSSNCVHCQPNAQRFRNIVRRYYHNEHHGADVCLHPPTTLCGSPCGGVDAPGSPDRCRKRLKTTMSSIWDYSIADSPNQTRSVARSTEAGVAPVAGGGVGEDSQWEGEYWFKQIGTFNGSYQRLRGSNVACTHEIVSGLEWEPTHGHLLATAGVSKQVRVYSSGALDLEGQECSKDPIRLYRLANKLSSLSWSPARAGVVCVGDYDGGVTEMDLETGHILSEGEEHSGRRVWSVSYSKTSGIGRMVSASEDGTVAVWEHGQVVGRIDVAGRKSAATGVEVSPWNSHLVGISSADSNAYVYDMRILERGPVRSLRGHERPVSYIKFFDQNTVVTAGIDSSLISWNLSGDRGDEKALRYSKHCNNKHFVGLSLLPEEGLVSCGSETGHVFCYGKGRGDSALATYRPLTMSINDSIRDQELFCTAVAWQPHQSFNTVNNDSGPIVAAALSDDSISICRLLKESS